jgi:hypothetical protein
MKIKIFRDLKQFTLTSSLKVEDIALVKKYRPNALKKKDKDGNDIFAISYVEGRPCVAANGITFGSTSAEGGFAMITGEIPATLPEDTTASDYVADKVGGVLAFIDELEKSIPDAVTAIKDERAKLMGEIAVV